MSLQVGTVIERDSDQARFRLTAAEGRSWIGERVGEDAPWTGAVRLTPRALAGFHLVDGDEIEDVRTPKHRADAGEPAFFHDGSTIHPASAAGWSLAGANAQRARAAEPGWSALADEHRAKQIEAARQHAEEDRLEQLHAVIADEV